MDAPIQRAEHEEFCKRMEDEHRRLNKRIEVLETAVKRIADINISVAELASSMKSMLEEQKDQGERLKTIEDRDGEMWRKVLGYIATTIVGVVIGFIFTKLGM